MLLRILCHPWDHDGRVSQVLPRSGMRSLLAADSMSRFATERGAILDDVEAHPRQIRDLKMRLNTFADIGQLPIELLPRIFVAYAQDRCQSATCKHPRLTSPDWIRLARICRHWHDVALETSHFWSFLCVRKITTLSALLPLSKSSPLYIYLYSPQYDSNDTERRISVVELIAQESHRLRRLHCDANLTEFRSLSEKLSRPLPVLEHLVLLAWLHEDPDRSSQPLHILPAAGNAPRLHHVELHQFPFIWSLDRPGILLCTDHAGSHRSG